MPHLAADELRDLAEIAAGAESCSAIVCAPSCRIMQGASCTHVSNQPSSFWDLVNGEERRPLAGHEGSVSDCAVSADRRTGLSASEDQTLIVWDTVSGQQSVRFPRNFPSFLAEFFGIV